MKYIMFESSEALFVHRQPVVFAESLTHVLVANAMLTSPELKGFTAVRAGFYHEDLTFGESVSLDLASIPEDALVITYPSLYGIGMPQLWDGKRPLLTTAQKLAEKAKKNPPTTLMSPSKSRGPIDPYWRKL